MLQHPDKKVGFNICWPNINYETYVSIVGACLHQNNVGKFENRYPLLNILVSLHVGMLNPIHASLKLVFQPPSFIDQSLQPLESRSSTMASSTEQALFVNKEWTVGGGHIKSAVHFEACDTEEFVDDNGDRHVFMKLCKSDNKTQRLIFGASSTSCGMSMSKTTIIEQISQSRDFHRSQLIEKLKKEAADQELQKHQDAMHGKVDATVDDAASTIADSMTAPNSKRGEKRKVSTRLSLPKYISFEAPPMYTREAAQSRANVDDPCRFLARDRLFDGVEISCKISQDPERQSYPALWLECTPSVIDYLHRFAVEEAERGVHVVHPRSSGSGRDSSGSIMTGLSRMDTGKYKGYFRYKSRHFRDNKSVTILAKNVDDAVRLVHELLNDDTLPAGFPPKSDSDLEVSDSANESDESVALESMVDGSMIDGHSESNANASDQSQMLVQPGRPDPTSPASSTPNASESSEFYKTFEAYTQANQTYPAYTQANPEKGGDGRKWPVGRNTAEPIEELG